MRHRKFPIIGDGAGVWSFLHVDGAAHATHLAIENKATGLYNIVDDEPAARFGPIQLGIPFLAGRGFAETDAKQPVAILNQTLARQLFGNENPIGRTILLPTATEVIGVVRDAATSGLDRHDGMFYRPLEDTFPPRLLIKARNSAEVGTALQALVQRGLVKSARGVITVLDREGLMVSAGHTYGVPEREYRRLLGR